MIHGTRLRATWLVALCALTSLAAAQQRRIVRENGREVVAGELLIKLAPGVTPRSVEALHRQTGARVIRNIELLGFQLVQAGDASSTRRARGTYRGDPRIAFVQPNYVYHLLESKPCPPPKNAVPRLFTRLTPNDPMFGSLWGMTQIQMPQAWDISTGSPNVIAAVIDTGVDYNHPDLQANMWVNPGETPNNNQDDDGNGVVDDIYGYNAGPNNGDPMDNDTQSHHGTHVAGTVGAVGNNGLGVVGVNWTVKIMAVNIFDGATSNATFSSNAVAGINYVANMVQNFNQNVRVTNNSWGAPRGTLADQAIQTAFQALDQLQVVNVVAAGNDGADNDQIPDTPSGFDLPSIIAVAANDSSERLAVFSNFGLTSVDLSAPGVGILSTEGGSTGYQSLMGTSQAAPHVAGAAALVAAVNPTFTAVQIKDRLLQTVDIQAGYIGKLVTGGRLNVFRAVTGDLNDTTSLKVFGINPSSALNVSPLTGLQVFGQNFQSGLTATLTMANQTDIPATDVQVADAQNFTCTFNITNAQPGVWDLVVANPDGTTAPLTGALTIEALEPILLVDDDGGSTYETFYQAALAANNQTYNLWSVALQGEVPIERLRLYQGQGKAVIWFTGDEFRDTLTSTEQQALTSFLNGSGRLFITGQDIGWDMTQNNAGPSFYIFRLHSQFVADTASAQGIAGVVGDPISDGVAIQIVGGDGANNQVTPDVIGPVSPAVAIFNYDPTVPINSVRKPVSHGRRGVAPRQVPATEPAALRVDTGPWRLVYFAFGFEGIGNASIRATLLQRIVDWLGQTPNPPPQVNSISPDRGVNTGPVDIISLTGSQFRSGASVRLSKANEQDIVATNVTVLSDTKITCTFDLTGKAAGAWNVVVTNSDGQTGTLANGFTIEVASPLLNAITPATGANVGTVDVTVFGDNFAPGLSIELTLDQDTLRAGNVQVQSVTQATGRFDLTGAALGKWTVSVKNVDGQGASIVDGFVISTPPKLAACAAGEALMFVTFDRAMVDTEATDISLYRLESPPGQVVDLSAATATYDVDLHRVTISPLTLTQDAEYQLTLGAIHAPEGGPLAQNGIDNVCQGIVQDVVPPTLLSARATVNRVTVVFSESVKQADAINYQNYRVESPLPVLKELRFTSIQYDDATHTATISGLHLVPTDDFRVAAENIQDLNSNPVGSPDSVTGKVELEIDIAGGTDSGGNPQLDLVTIPMVLANADPAAVFGNGVPVSRFNPSLNNGAGGYETYPTVSFSLEAGRAYFVQAPAAVQFNTSTGTPLVTSGSYRVNLQQGWNLLGNPFVDRLVWDLDNIRYSHNGSAFVSMRSLINNPARPVEPYGWTWHAPSNSYMLLTDTNILANSAGLAVTNVLELGDGFFLYAAQSNVTLEFDAPLTVPVTASAGRTHGRGWASQMMVASGDQVVPGGVFGIAPQSLRLSSPPSPVARRSGLQAGFLAGGQRLLVDVRSTSRPRWEFEAGALGGDTDVTLSWSALGSAPRNLRFHLIDTVTGARTSMRTAGSYTFHAAPDAPVRRFVIETIDSAAAGLRVAGVTVERLAPGKRGVRVSFTVNAPAQGTLRVLSPSGRTVYQSPPQPWNVGRNVATWNGRSSDGRTAPAGVYLLEIRARSADGTSTRTVRSLALR